MNTAKAFNLKSAGSIYVVDYCVDGLHVNELGDGGIAIAPRGTVTLCDKSCENCPVLQEQQFSDQRVAALRALVGKGLQILL